MRIELSSPTHLRLSWPVYSSEIESEIKRRLNTVPGIEAGHGRVAWCPVIQLARLLDLFPKGSFDYRAIQEADKIAQRFYQSLVSMGVQFGFDEFGDPMAVGDNVSPLLQQLIHDRRHALKPFVEEAMKHPVPMLQGPLPEISVGPGTLVMVDYPRRKSRAKRKAK